MFKTNLLAKHVKLALLASMTVVTPLTANAAEEVNQAEITNDVEVISVTGVRSSLRDAAFLKKSASQIMDAISAEDIGQLPDNNMAEALQRVTGIQINRDDTGSGSGFQVRGLSQNRVEIDGQSMAGSGEDRSNNFGSIDSALFSGVEVIKSPMADMTEGGIGATVRLKSREPLSFKKPTVNINAALKQDVLADDKGNKLAILGADKYDLGDLGEFGVLVNLTRDEANRATHQFGSNWQLATKEQLDGSDIFLNDDGLKINLYRPQNLALQQQEFAEDKYGANLNLQWAINENAQP